MERLTACLDAEVGPLDHLQGWLVQLRLVRPPPRPAPTEEEASDLGVLWQMLHLHLHPNWPDSIRDLSQDRRQLTRAEFQLAF
eukprot:149190-Prymnesium_polylepis.1